MEIRRESIKYNGQRGGGEATGGLAGHVARVHAGVTQISHLTPCHPQVSPSTVTFLCDRMDRTHRQALGVFLVVFVGILGVGGPWRGRALRGIPEEGGRSSLENTAAEYVERFLAPEAKKEENTKPSGPQEVFSSPPRSRPHYLDSPFGPPPPSRFSPPVSKEFLESMEKKGGEWRRKWKETFPNGFPVNVGVSRKGDLCARVRSPPYEIDLAPSGDWAVTAKTQLPETSNAVAHVGSHGVGISGNLGVRITPEYVGRYIFEGALKAPTSGPSDFFLRMPPISPHKWKAAWGSALRLERPLLGGNASVGLVPEPLKLGVAYVRHIPQLPLKPRAMGEFSSTGCFAELRAQRPLEFVSPRLSGAVAVGARKEWYKEGPIKLALSLEVIVAGVGRMIAMISGGKITVRPVFD
ncbi:hypothetical protein AAMO2058_001504600 [Amorphochlora amoebiformis]